MIRQLANLYATCMREWQFAIRRDPDPYQRGYAEGRVAGVALALDVVRGEP